MKHRYNLFLHTKQFDTLAVRYQEPVSERTLSVFLLAISAKLNRGLIRVRKIINILHLLF